MWGKVTEGPEFPAPLAFAVPGLCLLGKTHMMDDSAYARCAPMGPPGSSPSLHPLLLEEVKQIVSNGVGFLSLFFFPHGIFVRRFYKPLNDISKKKSCKKKSEYGCLNWSIHYPSPGLVHRSLGGCVCGGFSKTLPGDPQAKTITLLYCYFPVSLH